MKQLILLLIVAMLTPFDVSASEIEMAGNLYNEIYITQKKKTRKTTKKSTRRRTTRKRTTKKTPSRPSWIKILGDSTEMRAVALFSGNKTCLDTYVKVAKAYADSMGEGVHVYCMPIPLSSEFYVPEGETPSRLQRDRIDYAFRSLGDTITGVSISDTLFAHRDENIYARTDHHWLPMGAYYAAREFAKAAKVPFRSLDSYDEYCVHDFVGTMPNTARCPGLAKWPEEFVYYMPRDVEYKATYITYRLNSGRSAVIGETDEYEAEIFRKYQDGSKSTYCTFLGGDPFLISIDTNVRNGRRLLILKDSFGNALPAYLLYSFERICVVDCRYFTKNIIDYCKEKEITDILFANNITHACSSKTTDMYVRYLKQNKKQ